MNKIISYLLVTTLFIFGCQDDYQPTPSAEHTVYEAIFLNLKGDAISPYYLASKTEISWFNENEYKEEDWSYWLEENGNAPISVVNSLYKQNRVSEGLTWKPIITNGTLLPKQFANLTPENTEQLCLVGETEKHIDVRHQNGMYFRPYYTVSKVGFSHDGIFALVKLTKNCAPLSGAGEFFLLLKFENKKWQTVGGKDLWIS